MRERIEAWYGPSTVESAWAARDIWDAEAYQSSYAQTAWLAWQASRQQALEEAAALCLAPDGRDVGMTGANCAAAIGSLTRRTHELKRQEGKEQ